MSNEYEQKIAEAQNKLSTIMTAINRENLILETKIKERQDMESEVSKGKEEIESNKLSVQKNREEKTISEEKLLEAKSELNKELGVLEDLKKKREEAEKELLNFQDIVKEDISKLNTERSNFVKEFENKKYELQLQLNSVSETKSSLENDISVKENIIKTLNSQIAELSEKVEVVKSSIADLEKEKTNISDTLRSIKNDVLDQETYIKKNKIKFENLQLEINDKEVEKIAIEVAIEELNKTRAEFVQAKMVLHKDREELTNRELFIMDKYEQAGLPYRDGMLSGTKNTIEELAQLRQREEDLDKREAYIKEKYKQAGLDYL